MTLPESVGQIVRAHRKRAGLSQIELADLAGVGKASVWDIEQGKLTVQLDTMVKVLTALNIKIQLKSPLMEELASDLKEKKQ